MNAILCKPCTTCTTCEPCVTTDAELGIYDIPDLLFKCSCERRLSAASESAAVEMAQADQWRTTRSAAQALSLTQLNGMQEDFATQPVQVVQLIQAPLDEEALHMSFEEAISDRVSALGINWQQSITTDSLQHSALSNAITTLTATASESVLSIQQRAKNWQRNVAYVCLPLMFMLIGFDLMGLLILHVR